MILKILYNSFFFFKCIFDCDESSLLLGLFRVAEGRGCSLVAVCGLLTGVVSLVVELWLCQLQQLPRTGSLPRSMWDPPQPEIKLVSSALQGGSQPLDHQGSPPLQLLIELFKNIYIKLNKTKDLALEGHSTVRG